MATDTARERAGAWTRRESASGQFREGKATAKDRVQVQNPVTGHWIKVDTANGRIIDEKRTDGPFKGVAIRSVGKRSPKN